MGAHLKTHNQEEWDHINLMTTEIFIDRERVMKERMKAYKQMLDESGNR